MKTILERKEAKVGDLIRAYDFDHEPEKGLHSDYYQGVVTAITTHPHYGYTCVEYTAIKSVDVCRRTGEVEREEDCFRKMRCPQNGTPTTLGRKTNNIAVFKEVE